MGKEAGVFDSEYTSSSGTTATPTKEPGSSKAVASDMNPEVQETAKRYGGGKPRRIIIRAELTNDQS